MLRVILAEDHKIVRDGIKMLLNIDKSIEVIGEAVNGLEVLGMIENGLKPDVILADINMPQMDGITLLKELRQVSPETKVVMLSMLDNEEYVAQTINAGASGYLLKNVSADELIFSIKHVSSGGSYLCSELAFRLIEKSLRNSATKLSPEKLDFSLREIEILHLIAEGLTNHEMSEKLFISKRTVEGHRQSLIDKTGSKNTAALIRYAVTAGIVQ